MNRLAFTIIRASTTPMVVACFSWLSSFAIDAHAATDGNDLGDSATFEQLLGGNTTISTPDGSLRIGQFFLFIDPASTDAPALGDITVTVNSSLDSLQSLLSFFINGPSQILTTGESYRIELEYTVESLNSELEFLEVSLDIDGGTLGTSGTGFAEVSSTFSATDDLVASASTAVFPIESSVVLDVFNDGDGEQQLTSHQALPRGISALAVMTTLSVDGGMDGASGAVFTDFAVGFVRSTAIPEPSSLFLALLAFGLSACEISRKSKCTVH